MAYDEVLAERIRTALRGRDDGRHVDHSSHRLAGEVHHPGVRLGNGLVVPVVAPPGP
jgi:hypothetical protein